MNLLLIDDHLIFRSALISLLKAILERDCEFHEANNGMEAIPLIKKSKYDLIFLDLSMPGMNGYETCKHILTQPSHPPIIILTQHTERAIIHHFKSLGVSFITKGTKVEILQKAISVALVKGQYIEEGLFCNSSFSPNSLLLSKKEKQLINKISSGFSSKEIALQMDLSAKSVDTYRERLLKKMKVKNVAELIAYIFKTGNEQL